MEAVIAKKYQEWLNSEYLDAEDRAELKAIENDEKEIVERFYQDLAFGTGGMRGIRGVGTNRLNKYMIRKATQGLANYMLKNRKDAKEKGIVIAYDSRIMSVEFALNTALVMAGNGIKTYLFESLRSTPELSFAVRELGALSGIVITASHNPPEYNGYKAYWEDGAQVVAPHDTGIITEVNAIVDFSEIKLADEKEALANGTLVMIGKEIDDKYIEVIKKVSVKPGIVKTNGDFRMVYTPLHGAGNVGCQRILKEAGYTNVFVVKEQEQPDGNFPTASYPNPEDPKVFALGIKLADEKGATIVMANDPDADRIGIASKTKDGEWIYPNGNQVGLLLSEYILKNTKNKPENGVIVSTVVSTPMLDKVAKANGVDIMRTLTGFKFIGEKIKEFEEGVYDKTYMFGFEESYGYLAGTHARDKDAIVTTMLVAEMAAYFESIGSSVKEELDKMYEKYGFYREGIEAVTMQGKEGGEKIAKIMEDLRTDCPTEMVGKKVVKFSDFKAQTEKDLVSGKTTKLKLPSSNVLQFVLEDGTYITARPSGTEPKIKFYFGVNAETEKLVEAKLETTMKEFLKTVL